MRYWHPETQTLYSSLREAQKSLKVLAPDLPPVTVAPRPTLAVNEVATQDALPTQDANGDWVIGWTVTTIAPAEMEQRVQDELARVTEQSTNWDRAIAYTLADLWRQMQIAQGNNITVAEARQQVKNRMQANLREIKGL